MKRCIKLTTVNSYVHEICVTQSWYVDQSGWAAIPVADTLSVGNVSAEVPFNAIQYMVGFFQEVPTSGIMGLGAKWLNCGNNSIASSCYPGAMESLLSSTGLPNKLGFCLGLGMTARATDLRAQQVGLNHDFCSDGSSAIHNDEQDDEL